MSASLSAVAHVTCAPDTIGQAFNALNPRMDARPVTEPPGQPVTVQAEAVDPAWRDCPKWGKLPVCGVVTISNVDWVPKKSSDVPPSPTKGYGWKLSADFCRLFNQSEFARRRRRWAVLTNRGDALILCGIRDEDRPLDPAAFPPCVQDGLTYHEAETKAITDNAARFAVARVPRQWTISLRRIDAAAYGDRSEAREGGDA